MKTPPPQPPKARVLFAAMPERADVFVVADEPRKLSAPLKVVRSLAVIPATKSQAQALANAVNKLGVARVLALMEGQP
jgi:hypothetical protein